MIRKGMIMLLAMAIASPVAWAQPPATQPATQPSADDIAALIAQLGAPQFSARTKAEKALIQFGPAVEPALRDAVAHSPSSEIRTRAKAAVDKIEDNLPDAPTRVSLLAKGENPAKVCQSMADQAGVAIVPQDEMMWSGQNGPVAPIDLKLDRVPFLVALEHFCKATRTRPNFEGGIDGGVLEICQGNSGVWDQEDRLAIVATGINHDRSIELGSNNANRQDTLSVNFMFDPRRKIVTFQQPQVLVAQDENGASYVAHAAGNPNQDFNINPFEDQLRWGVQAMLPLSFPPHPGKTLTLLQGSVKLRVASKVQRLTIPDLAKAAGGAGTTAGNRKVEVLTFDINNNDANLHVRISNTNPPGMFARVFGNNDSPNLFGEFESASLVDANGTIIFSGGGGGGGSDVQVDWQGAFHARAAQPLKGPISLRWDVITETKEITVPFEFKNLQLPAE